MIILQLNQISSMLKYSKLLSPFRYTKLFTPQIYRFSNEVEQSKPKSYVMPPRIQRDTTYYTDRPVTFRNGRHLIYMNKQNLSTPFLIGLHYTIPLTYIAYLICTNPFYLTFPAALPLMLIVETVLLLFWIEHKSLHKRQVERIYLVYPGTLFEIVYANKIRRYVKSNNEFTVHNVLDFEPKYDHEIPTGKVKPYPGVRFPADPNLPLSQAQKPNLIQYGWSFRDKTFNTFILPAKYEYADEQFLSKVLNGIPIICRNSTQEGQYDVKTYPKIEDQQKNIQRLKIQNAQIGVPKQKNKKPQAVQEPKQNNKN